MSEAPVSKLALWQRLWGFWISRRVAVVLLSAVLVALLLNLGRPREAAGDVPALLRGPLFAVLLGALLLNTLCCTLARLGRLWPALTRRPSVRLADEAYPEAPVLSCSGERLRRVLRRHCGRLWEESAPDGTLYVYAERFRWSPLGTVLLHLGLFLLLLAAFLHAGLAGRRTLLLDPPLADPERLSLNWQPVYDAEFSVRSGSDCRVANAGFDLSRENGALQQVQGTLMLDMDPRGLARIAPGHSCRYCGANLYLDSYGLALRVRAADAAGQPLSLDLEGQVLRFEEGVAEAAFALPELGWRVSVAPSAWALAGFSNEPLFLRVDGAGQGRPLFEGQLSPRETLLLPGVQLTFDPYVFMEVEVVRDPGWPWFVAAGLCLALGSAAVLLFPRCRLWARLSPEGRLRLRFAAREAELEDRPRWLEWLRLEG
ncbi:MAG: cytochrome c biogenesis protein ResB [Chloroflexia bacterium]|nr:cytochrome c biogenesis protein ResB [Chloroflexia bacterium]